MQLAVEPLEESLSLKDRIYRRLKAAITSTNVYAEGAPLRLDERQLSERLGISRTPVREALVRLEQEGLVRIVPRRGVYIVRKTKAEILEMIIVWAALEAMAARLITERASDEEIATLRALFSTFDGETVNAQIDEYSERNIDFHTRILRLSKCELLNETANHLFMHMRSIRSRTISENDRAQRSMIDHMHIIEAIEARDAELAERLVREHTMSLARHVEANVEYLD